MKAVGVAGSMMWSSGYCVWLVLMKIRKRHELNRSSHASGGTVDLHAEVVE